MRQHIWSGLAAVGLVAVSAAGPSSQQRFEPDDEPRLVDTPYLEVALHPVRRPVGPDGELALEVDVTPKPRIHVYAPGETSYRPLALSITPQPGLVAKKAKLPPGEIFVFEPTGERMLVYTRPVRLTQPLGLRIARRKTATVKIEGTLSYQACDDHVCYRPVTVPLTWTVPVR